MSENLTRARFDSGALPTPQLSALHLPAPGFRSMSHNVVNGDENVVVEVAEIRILGECSHEAEC
jgi:hypothetical protein